MLEANIVRNKEVNARVNSSGQKVSLPVDGKTVSEAYLRRLELNRNDRIFLAKKDGVYKETTWGQAHSKVLALFASMRKIGIQKGDRVAIMSNSRPEWILCDVAILSSGAVTVPVYQSTSVEDISYILEHSGAKLLFVEDQLLAIKVNEAFKEMGHTIPTVLYSDSEPEILGFNSTPFKEFSKMDPTPELEADFVKSVKAITSDQIASVVYTSGTTGRPKGVVLTHANFTSGVSAVTHEVEITSRDVTLTFLPFAHIVGREESLSPIFGGLALGFAESINSVAQNIGEVCPTLLISVPRIYEKIFAKITADINSKPEFAKKLALWSIDIGRQYVRLLSERKSIPIGLLVKYRLANRLVFRKVRAKLGGNIRVTLSGGAPLSPDICEFFHACGIKVLEGYGLTETLGAITVNHPNDYRFGTVGKPLRGVELKIASDGEILVRAPMVFREYFKNPEATKEAFTPDGWFCTGDIGEIDNRGFLKITDRKKELIVTSGGKNIAPQKLENLLKTVNMISNGMVYGDKQKYLVALICLNEEEIKKWAQTQGISWGTFDELIDHPKVNTLVEEALKKTNANLASYETIKRFKILPKDFTVETGELTPSLKLKRKVITQKFLPLIQSMY